MTLICVMGLQLLLNNKTAIPEVAVVYAWGEFI